MKIGIVFGGFIPWHVGHQKMFDLAKEQNDLVIVAVCGSVHDRGKYFIPLNDRYDLVKKKFIADEKVICCLVDDDLCGCDGTFTLENWIRWSALLFKGSNFDPLDDILEFTWYTGEMSYVEKLKQVYPKHKFVLLDRDELPISGTKIRGNLIEMQSYVDRVFLEYLKRKGFYGKKI